MGDISTACLKTGLLNHLTKNYSSFILTISCIGVSIYHTDNGSCKIFDARGRDEYGGRHPSGMCLPLEVTFIFYELTTVFLDCSLLATIVNSKECTKASQTFRLQE